MSSFDRSTGVAMVDLFALCGSGRRGTSCHVMQIIADTHKNCWPSFAVFSGETRWETNRQKTSGTAKVQAESTDEPHRHVPRPGHPRGLIGAARNREGFSRPCGGA